MILALQHHKIVKSSYNIFIGYYHNVPFSHFGAEDFSTAKFKKKKKTEKKNVHLTFDVFVTTVLLQSLKYSCS